MCVCVCVCVYKQAKLMLSILESVFETQDLIIGHAVDHQKNEMQNMVIG